MDERTRTTDDDLAPNLRRTAPAPDVKSRPNSKFRIAIGLIVVIVLALGGYQIFRWVHAPQPSGGRFQAGGLQSVGAATVTLGNIRVIVSALGTVTPLATVTVQTQISGQLTQVGFTEGQMVQKGDFLAQIDQRPYEILKAQYEGQLAHDQGLLDQAQMDLKRYQTLAAQNSIARQQAEDQVFIVQQYAGSVKQDQGQVDAETLNIAYCHIVSPVTGRVGLRLVDPGNYVQTTTASSIAVVTQLQPITVIFSIPEDDLPEIVPQLNAGTKLQVTAYDRSNTKKLATGQVSALDNQIDTTTGTVKVRAQFDNSDDALFPNQFVNARLLVKTLENVVTVPTAAIQLGAPGSNAATGASGSYVYVVNADDTVSVHQITTGPTDGTMTAVNSGLSAGQRVVVDGADRLRDGLHVRISSLDGKPAAAPSPAAGPGGPGARGGQRRSQRGAQGGAPASTAQGASAPTTTAPGAAGPAANPAQSQTTTPTPNQRTNNGSH
jgi:multidrug efflux system membrane fusion protein